VRFKVDPKANAEGRNEREVTAAMTQDKGRLDLDRCWKKAAA
jgi:hypothetical protein